MLASELTIPALTTLPIGGHAVLSGCPVLDFTRKPDPAF